MNWTKANVHLLAVPLALLAVSIGAVSLTGRIIGEAGGWQFVSPTAMTTNTAAGLILVGLALILLANEDPRGARMWIGVAAAGLVAFFALGTVFQFIVSMNIGIDELITADSTQVDNPGRPSIHAAATLLMLSLWLITLVSESATSLRLRLVFGSLAAIVVVEIFVGTLFGVSGFFRIGGGYNVAPQTVAALGALCVGMDAARPSSGMFGLALSRGAGGHLFRTAIVFAFFGPLGVGLLILLGKNSGVLVEIDDVALFTAIMVTVSVTMLAIAARSVNRFDEDRRRLTDELADLADRDPLTNLFNRRRFDKDFLDRSESGSAPESSLALALVDIDGLKAVNDNLGHRAGDELITGVAQAIRSHFRDTDVVARLGGDEFGILLPGADAEGGRVIAEKLLGELRSTRWKVDDATIEPSISIGIAVVNQPIFEPEMMFAAADAALYEGKDAGGNCYRIVEPTVPALIS